jgi:hypothetical protein
MMMSSPETQGNSGQHDPRETAIAMSGMKDLNSDGCPVEET